MIKKKTYRRYMKRIERLMALNPALHTKKGIELLRLARAAENYENAHFLLGDHRPRRVRADLVSEKTK